MTSALATVSSSLTSPASRTRSLRKKTKTSEQEKTESVAEKALLQEAKMAKAADVKTAKRSAIPPASAEPAPIKSRINTKRKQAEESDESEAVEQKAPAAKTARKDNQGVLLIDAKLKSTQANDIKKEYNALAVNVGKVPYANRGKEQIAGTGKTISVAELIAYQIGWGKRVIEWYEKGIKGEKMVMPGDGFNKWSYSAMALYFYKTYQYDRGPEQDKEFHRIVTRIIEIVEKEAEAGNLDKEGVWPWTQLASGKWWPLSRWVHVNTSAPYKKAAGWVKNAS